MKKLFLAATCLALAGCKAGSAGSVDAPPVPFELRGLTLDTNRTEYAINSTHKVTVVAVGDSAAIRNAYIVYYRVETLSGGDPEQRRTEDDFTATLVTNGVGQLSIPGGYRLTSETWEAEKIALHAIGYVPVLPIAE